MAGLKQAIVSVSDQLGCFPLGFAAQKLAFGRDFVRVLNYHATPAACAAGFERQLQFYARHFHPATPDDLDDCLAGEWRHNRPGLLLTFDDGYRSNYDVAAPLLEAYGFRGWFFLPTAYVAPDRAAADAAFADAAGDEPEPRMTWDECRDLSARGHRMGCHTRTHVRLEDNLSPQQLTDEITLAGLTLAEHLNQPVEDFCWVGGEEWSYGRGAFQEVRRAGYRRAFMTNLWPVTRRTSPLWIQRTNIEADWPLEHLRFYLSGLMDLAYAPKRARLAKKLGGH